MDFIWEEAGISLHFPAAACETDIKISVGIFTDLEQNCIFPQRYRLMPMASSTYEITSSAPLPAPVRVRMEHCAIVEKQESLVHMVAHSGPPYRFEPLNSGNFPLNESYGEIELKRFCLLAIFYKIFNIKMTLAVFVAYKKQNIVHFLVTKNCEAYCTAVREVYGSTIESEYTMCCSYATTEISLSMPSPDSKGWCIAPSRMPTEVDMHDVHTYQPGSVIPRIELKLKWQGEGDPSEQEIEIGVQGGSTEESFKLTCKPEKPEQPEPTALLSQPQSITPARVLLR